MPPKRLTYCVDPEVQFSDKTQVALDTLAALGTQVSIVHDIEECLDHDVLNIQTQDLTSKVKSTLEGGDLPSYSEKDAFTITADKILKAKSIS